MELVLHQRLHCEQHVAIRVIEQIQRGEHDQCGARMEFRGSHGSSEYSTAVNCLRSENVWRVTQSWSRFCFVYFFLTGLGHLATTVVEIPPRGRNSPLTSAHTGFAHRTTSSRTRLTTFS